MIMSCGWTHCSSVDTDLPEVAEKCITVLPPFDSCEFPCTGKFAQRLLPQLQEPLDPIVSSLATVRPLP